MTASIQTPDETIKRPVVYSNGKLGPMIVDGEGLSIAVAAFGDREQQALEHIALCINEHPRLLAELSATKQSNEVLRQDIEELRKMNHDLRRCIEDDASKIFRNENTSLKAEIERLKLERDLLRIALADAIRRPLGVEPYSAYGLIGHPELDMAEERLRCTDDKCHECRAIENFVDIARQALSEK